MIWLTPLLSMVRPSQIPTRLIRVPGDSRTTSAIPTRLIRVCGGE